MTIAELNLHPINRAASAVLSRAGTGPREHAPGIMPVLLLAISELATANETDVRLQELALWANSPMLQAKALARLEHTLTADDLMMGSTWETAEQIAAELMPF